MSKAGSISLTCQALSYAWLCEDSHRLWKGRTSRGPGEEKNPLGEPPNLPWGNLPFLGAGNLSHSPGTATFPQVFGILLHGRSKRYTLVPLGTKESKHAGAGKKSLVRQVGQVVSALVMAGEDNDPNRDPVPKGQVSRPGPPLSPLFPLPPFPGHTSSPVLPLSIPQGLPLGAPPSVGH